VTVVCKFTPRWPPPGGGGGSGDDWQPPSYEPRSPLEELLFRLILGMGCLSFLLLLVLIVVWHSPLVAR
jgi:hypothetical protein